jgi:cytidine deaminase
VVLDLGDGKRITGAAIESVAFNPTIPPLQAALIDLLAHGYGYDDIREVTLGTVLGGAVDYARSTAELLDRVAPDADLTVTGWLP